MASVDGAVIDLNNPVILDLHNQILLFKNSPFEHQLLFHRPDRPRQRTLQSLAHRLDLECEYTATTRILKITRPVPEELTNAESNYDDPANFGLLESVGGAFEDALTSGLPSFGDTIRGDFSQDMPRSNEDVPLYGELGYGNDAFLNLPGLEVENFLFQREEMFPSSSNFNPLDSTSMYNIALQNGGTPGWSQERELEQGERSYAEGYDAFALSDITLPPGDLILDRGKMFIRDDESTRDIIAKKNKHKPQDCPRPVDLDSMLQGSLGPSRELGVNSTLSLDYTAEYEAARISNNQFPLPGKRARKRKNAQRSVSPTYSRPPPPLISPNTPDSVHGSPIPSPSSQSTKEPNLCAANWRLPGDRFMCLHPECWFSTSRQEDLDEHFRRGHPKIIDPKSINQNAASRSTSVSSQQSYYGRWEVPQSDPLEQTQQSKRGRSGFRDLFSFGFGRRSSVAAVASSGYKEIVFDSRSNRSEQSSQGTVLSNASCASGRRGPLTEWARAGMNAVKAIGACWRCRFLRKTCALGTPCALCPKPNDKSTWGAVGCHRGPFQSVMDPVVLCPNSFLALDPDDESDLQFWVIPDNKEETHPLPSRPIQIPSRLPRAISHREEARIARQKALDQINQIWKNNILEREQALERIGWSKDAAKDSLALHHRQVRQLFRMCFPGSKFSPYDRQSSSECIPLHECILAIAWDSDTSNLECLANLLPRAAAYQADHQEDQLIAQSLICLRTSLEAMRVQSYYRTPEFLPHNQCSSSSCKIECIAQVKANISLYIEELSRVFFKKANMRDKHQWWLSTFYSFCIQSCVKKCLMRLETEISAEGSLACREYLQLPINLFIASSNNYDPLKHRLTQGSSGKALEKKYIVEERDKNDYKEAQVAVGRNKWVADRISGSADYLRSIFANSIFDNQTNVAR